MATTALGAGIILPTSPALAQSQGAVSYDIEGGPLAIALNRFAESSGVELFYDAELTDGLISQGLQGSFGTAEALSRLLNGTGLTFRQTGENAFTLELAPQSADGAIRLGPVRVEGTTGRNTGSTGSGTEFGDGGDTGDLAYVSPQSSSYITRDEVERNRGFQASDIFRGTPGVLSGDARNSGALDLNIRGMQGMGRVPVVIDGAQHSTTVYRGYSGVASRSYVDPDLIGGVEIFKGPTSGADSVGGVGGVVRMRTIDASDILLPGNSFGVRVRGGFSTNTRQPPEPFTTGGLQSDMTGRYLVGCNYDPCAVQEVPDIADINDLGNPNGLNRPSAFEPTGGHGSLAVAKSWDWLDLVAAVSYRNTGNYFAGTHGNAPELTLTDSFQEFSDGRIEYYQSIGFDAQLNRYRAGEEVLNTSSENLSFLGKATVRPGIDHAIELSVMNYQSWFGELMPSMIIRGEGAVQAPMSSVDLDSYSARYKWSPQSDWIELRASVTRTELDNRIRTAYSFFSGALEFIQPYDARTHRTGVEISNRIYQDTPAGSLIANIGGSFSFEDTFQIPNAPETTLDGTPRDGWRREWSGFADAEWQPNQYIKLNGAIRYTQYESYDRKETKVYTDGVGYEIFNVAHNDNGWAPIAAVTISPFPWLQTYARYAEAIRMPSIFEVTRGWSQNPDPFVDVRPEHARNWEFGINVSRDRLFSSGDEFRAKVAYFDNNVYDYLTRTRGPTWDDTQQMVRNIDLAKFEGIEATLEYRNGPVALELFGTHYTENEFCTYVRAGSSSRREPSVLECSGGPRASYGANQVPPEWAGGGSVSVTLLDDRLTLFGRVTHTGGRPDEAVGATGALTIVKWDPYTLVDASVNFRLNENVSFDLTADNLTDAYYMDALTLGLMASPGRTIRGSVTLSF